MEFTAKNGMSMDVVDYIGKHGPNGLSFEKICEYVSDAHHEHAHKLRLKYARACTSWNTKHHDHQIKHEDWGDFADAGGYNGYVPCVDYFVTVFLKWAERRSEHVRRRMQMIDGEVMARAATGSAAHSHQSAHILHVQ